MKKEKIHNLLLFILIFVSILPMVLNKPLNNLDELWNYNFARNIADGLIPYKDFNMLQMPLLPIICGIILKIVENQLIVMRILAALLCTTIFFVTYKILITVQIRKEIAIIFTFLIAYLFKDIFCIDYNYATLLIVLLIILSEIKTYKKDNQFIKCNIKNDMILGILAGLTITLKQTTGIFICIALLGNKLLFVKNKDELKIYSKSFIFRLIGIMIPVSLMISYLWINGAIQEFISYTIKGVSGFSNYIPYTNIMSFNIIGILSILVPITFVAEWIKTIILGRDKNAYIFLVYGLAMFIVCFPISDRIHFLIGSLPMIILISNEFYKLLRKIYYKPIKESNLEKVAYGICVFIATFIIIFTIYYSFESFYDYLNNRHYSKLDHYRYIPIYKNLENRINNVNSYINSSNANVKILDATAAIYNIANNKYNKNYDMLLKGNLGYNGENKLIEEIEKSNNTQYLILKDIYHKNWQTPIEVINYVVENKEKIGEIEIFDIYE